MNKLLLGLFLSGVFCFAVLSSMTIAQNPVEVIEDENAPPEEARCLTSCFIGNCFRSFGLDGGYGSQYDANIAIRAEHKSEKKLGSPAESQQVRRRAANYVKECDGSQDAGNAYPGTGQCTANGNWSDDTRKKICKEERGSPIEEVLEN